MPAVSPRAPKGDKGLSHPGLRLRSAALPPTAWLLRFDGSCFGNGDRGARGKWGFTVSVPGGGAALVANGWTVADPVTNNVSEWTGLLRGLRAVAAGREKPPALRVEGDSKLVVEQLAGNWASNKPELTRLRDESRDLLAALGVPWSAAWIPREQNSEADQLTRPETLIEDWSAWGGESASLRGIPALN
ncbi:ribonuclease HI family protein [Limnoglobus roseus]|uniref:Ribonuclease H n=1 Tax=Limnoglobus roseus TaxID=2598579 RepID=A0A5C1ANY1_9BACT|nr:ribonuclease HI family protein [Limnoglobus roseus]QEL21109.1 ribonuclease H [Limnoglobus roseus]